MFSSRQVKEAKLLAAHARSELHKRKDIVSDVTYADVETEIKKLEAAAASGDETAIKEASEALDKAYGRVQPAHAAAGWRENCEVILVAFVLAVAIRAYFLQPFKIPTGSMQPTLNGIRGYPMADNEPTPNIFRRTFESLWLGRTYLDVKSEVDDTVVDFRPEKRFGFMEYQRIICESGRSYLVHAPLNTLRYPIGADGFGVERGHSYKAGETIVHGHVDTGDQVFVDKFTYNFRFPRRSDVFVFSTRNLPIKMEDPHVKSEFYIKRLAAMGGDTLRIQSPCLYRDGALAPEKGFARVMTQKEPGYRGYSNDGRFHFLVKPDDTYTVPADKYFALGDNSYNSSDSRNWGSIPAHDVVGRGLFVYYPFTRHWGPVN